MKWIIVDLDGTLSNFDHRLHFLKGNLKESHDRSDPDWVGFNLAAVNDKPNSNIIELVNHLASSGYRIVIMTGRNRRYSPQTILWLKENNVRNHLLMMRDPEDYRSDTDVKLGMLKKMIDLDYIHSKDQILFVIEDRDKLVEFWREMGFTCLQAAKGKY